MTEKEDPMLALPILSLPVALASFVLLYVIATKAPHAVESVNIVVWFLLPVVLGWKISRCRH